jgi:hypothetical protein
MHLARNISSKEARRGGLLEFKPVPPARGAVQMWTAANSDYVFRIALTRRFLEEADGGEKIVCVKAPKPVFVAYVSFPDGSHRCQIDRCFKTFDAAVRKCSKFTRELRRQVAYHEAGHAVVAHLLGFQGVWVDMKFSKLQAVTGWARNTLTPAMLTDDGALLGGGGDPEYRSAFVRALQDELIVAVAGLVAEAQIAGYQTEYVEPEVLCRAVQLVRACSALPICAGGKKCRAGLGVDHLDHERILKDGLPICSHRKCQAPPGIDLSPGIDLDDIVGYAEAEAFALLEANWRDVKRLVNALCRCDRFLLQRRAI